MRSMTNSQPHESIKKKVVFSEQSECWITKLALLPSPLWQLNQQLSPLIAPISCIQGYSETIAD